MHPAVHTYYASGKRVGVDFSLLEISLPNEEMIDLIQNVGFDLIIIPPIIQMARELIGKSMYVKADLQIEDAPERVHCATFVAWLYAQFGIWLPNKCLFQSLYGFEVKMSDRKEGDLVFIKGHHGLYISDPRKKIGHVGILTKEDTIIHAANSRRHVVEDTWSEFIDPKRRPIAIRRLTPSFERLATFQIPESKNIVMMLDVWRMLVKHLPV